MKRGVPEKANAPGRFTCKVTLLRTGGRFPFFTFPDLTIFSISSGVSLELAPQPDRSGRQGARD